MNSVDNIPMEEPSEFISGIAKIERDNELISDAVKMENDEFINTKMFEASELISSAVEMEKNYDAVKIEEHCIKKEDEFYTEPIEMKPIECCQLNDDANEFKQVKDDQSPVDEVYEETLNTHVEFQEDSPEMKPAFKCGLCKFSSNRDSHLQIHVMFSHKKHPEIEWLKCSLCNFKSNQKGSLEMHMLVHKDPSEIKCMECNSCNFKTKKKGYMDKEKEPSQIKSFDCDSCDETKLRAPTLIQEGSVFSCNLCHFQTKYKRNLRRHNMTMHTDPSVIQWHKCKSCSFKTKKTYALRVHRQLMHSDSSKIKQFECSLRFDCDSCDYQAENETKPRAPTLIQEDSVFACNLCHFKTKLKRNLRRHHMTMHIDPSDIKWHKCESCSFKTKKSTL
ncbi:hypothetical protein NQ315_015289 [Exocentrus adspersus]|uniref:Protein hunchback n=1 Tax=Exocentrus adspersus TaxID=1586481 RepID=A0AAV8VB57_9CUCU|nr:hypothetical protein NQ315_015289 [Exocentrus adspersus]